jgi:RNA polymerase sigma factor (sigma-70 family)
VNPRFTREEEAELVRKVREGIEARNQLLMSCADLAVSIASGYAWKNQEFDQDDLVSAALFGCNEVGGLLRCINKLDPSKGRLTTYAEPSMRDACRKYMIVHRSVIVRPRVAPKGDQLRDYHLKAGSVASLDADAGIRKGASKLQSKALGGFTDDWEKQAVKEAWGCLTERESGILKERMEGKTLTELGKEYGVTRERVRQIQSAAITKLQSRVLGMKDEVHHTR